MNFLLKHKIILFLLALVFLSSGPVFAQNTLIYHHYLEEARSAIREQDYHAALSHLETAQLIDSNNHELTQYINMVKRALERRLQIEAPTSILQGNIEVTLTAVDSFSNKSQETIVPPLNKTKKHEAVFLPQKKFDKTNGASVEGASTPLITIRSHVQKKLKESGEERISNVVNLDEAMWELQPDTELELPFDQEIVFHGEGIKRFLAIIPDILEVKRSGNKDLIVIPNLYGRTFFHIWDNGKRWTFHIRTVYRSEIREREEKASLLREKYINSFHFVYDFDLNSFSQGASFTDMKQQSLNERHYFSLYGPTPYGVFDSYMITHKTNTISTDITNYSVGLTGSEWGNFKNINLRLFDSNKYISDLTFPGRDFRGFTLEGDTKDDRFSLIAIRGEDRATFGLVSPGISATNESYFSAGKISFSPNENEKVSLNYANAWGKDKSILASSNVFSAEYKRETERWDVSSEIAYDEEEHAQLLLSQYQYEDRSFFVKFRNVSRDYATVVGPTGNHGEVGTEFSYGHKWGETDMNYFLDIYRDRDNKNPDNNNALNLDFNSSYRRQLSDHDFLYGNMYFIKTPGLLSDRKDFRFFNTYSHRFDFFQFENARLAWTASYQRARSDPTPSSDYDRAGIGANFSLPLNRNLNYSASYDMSYVNDVGDSNSKVYPSVFNTGFVYTKTYSSKWRANFSTYYRDEQKSEDAKSFLSGQDSLTLSTNVTYSPRQGVQFYVDGRARDVWAENDRTESFNEADIRLGLHSDWDLGYRWNPTGIIQGFIFKDRDGDGIRDDEDIGIPGVRVKVGEQEATTDSEGWYFAEIKAIAAVVSVDVNTIPKGFVFQDVSAWNFDIKHGNYYQGDFALTTESGIHGVVYYDENQNGRPDNADNFISEVRISLDNGESTMTDSRGAYFFYNIPAEKYVLSIDINSLSIQYLPKVPLINKIDLAEGSTYIFHIPVKRKSSGK